MRFDGRVLRRGRSRPALRRVGRKIVLSAGVLAALHCAEPLRAQTRQPDGVWGIGQVRAEISGSTAATIGVMYLDGLRITAPFLLVDRAIGSDWTINASYLWVTQSVGQRDNPQDHYLRAGMTFSREAGRVLFENRLLYEAILSDQGRDNANRLRNLTRITYKLAPQQAFEPRVFGHVEPVLDDRSGRPLRIDLALGTGATLPSGWKIDLFALRQTYPAAPRSGLDALVFQVLVPLAANGSS